MALTAISPYDFVPILGLRTIMYESTFQSTAFSAILLQRDDEGRLDAPPQHLSTLGSGCRESLLLPSDWIPPVLDRRSEETSPCKRRRFDRRSRRAIHC